jgi:hypothetical protein
MYVRMYVCMYVFVCMYTCIGMYMLYVKLFSRVLRLALQDPTADLTKGTVKLLHTLTNMYGSHSVVTVCDWSPHCHYISAHCYQYVR